MHSAILSNTASAVPSLVDGLGERFVLTDKHNTEPALELLRLHPHLAATPGFEFALRERTGRLANFRHAYYARVRRVDRLPEFGSALAVISEHSEGARLSEVLTVAEQRSISLDINAALCLLRQLVPAVALLHENARDVAHGAITAERIMVTPHARLVITEYVLGSAIERLQATRERLWREFRIPMPASAGVSRFDRRADVTQIGVIAMSLIVGRLLREDEYPNRLPDLIDEASETSVLGEREPLSSALRGWLLRALQLDTRQAFQSASEAQAALDELLFEQHGYIAAPIALEAFLERYRDSIRDKAPTPSLRPSSLPTVDVRAQLTASQTPAPELLDDEIISSLRESIRSQLDSLPDREPVRVSSPARVEHPSIPVSTEPAPPGVQPIERPLEPPIVVTTPVDEVTESQSEARRRRRRRPSFVVVALAAIALGEAAIILARGYVWPSSWTTTFSNGTVFIESNPPGARVSIDDRPQGVTPLEVSLKPGAHVVDIRGTGEPRIIPITVKAGAQVSQYIELASTVPGSSAQSDAQRALVPPIPSPESRPTEAAAEVSSVPAEALSGWLAFTAPVELQIYENQRLIGSTQTDRIMVSAGRHQLDLVNDTLRFRETRTLQVQPGKTTTVNVALPKGTVHINAMPWAEVWIDGEAVGETPLGNLSVPIGPHEIVFRHPQFGERRHAVTVTLEAPTRLSVDLRR